MPLFSKKIMRCAAALFLSCLLPISSQSLFSRPSFTDELNAASAIIIDAATGTVLFEKEADKPIPPASLTKLMTMHIALLEAQKGAVSLDEIVELPSAAWARNQPPRSSLMFLAQGHIVTLNELLLGLAIPSGNDAAQAVALFFAPTIEDFAALMNEQARRLGLSGTRFVEPSGIDENNITTASDFARFCREYIKLHPEALVNYHTVREFAYPKEENLPAYQRNGSNRMIVQYNHVPLLGTFEGLDGLKTGYIDESGYNAASTAERDGTRFIAVVLGVPAELGSVRGDRARAADCRALLTWAFANFKTVRADAPELPEVRVWKGKQKTVKLSFPGLSAFTVTQNRGEGLYWETELYPALIAPLDAGSAAGILRLYDDKGLISEQRLSIAEPVEKGGFFRRLWDSIVLFFSSKKTAENS